jgi:flagellar L-ring protein FlgH
MRFVALTTITLAVLAFLSNGCSAPQVRQAPVAEPATREASLLSPPIQQYPPPAPKTEGSLFTDDAAFNLFDDVRAHRIGDIVTINIVENSSASKQASSDMTRDSNLGAGLTALFGYETSLGFNDSFTPESALDVQYRSKYKGKAKTDRSDKMAAQISARVIQILPNGNLVIRGSREVTVNYEKQFIILQGVVRPEDIAQDNTVLSSYIADARIDYRGEGDMNRQLRKGWGTRFIDTIWPF